MKWATIRKYWGFEATTLLTTGELDIYNYIIEPDVPSATVSDAVIAIENVIINNDSANMENAKDLADEINNRDHNNNNS